MPRDRIGSWVHELTSPGGHYVLKDWVRSRSIAHLAAWSSSRLITGDHVVYFDNGELEIPDPGEVPGRPADPRRSGASPEQQPHAGGRTRALISVVIPVKDGGSDLDRCLAGIAAQQVDEEVEIVVVDSGSTDGSAERARAAGALVHEIPPGRSGTARRATSV